GCICILMCFPFTASSLTSTLLFPYTTLFRSAHARCRLCGRVWDLQGVPAPLALPEGFLFEESELEVSGVCAACAAKGRENFEIADRKSTRLNTSHVSIPYAVFLL